MLSLEIQGTTRIPVFIQSDLIVVFLAVFSWNNCERSDDIFPPIAPPSPVRFFGCLVCRINMLCTRLSARERRISATNISESP